MKTILCLLLSVLCFSAHARPSFARLNRAYDTGRITPALSEYLWTLDMIRQIRPELIGDWDYTLRIHGLRNPGTNGHGYSGDPTSFEWSVRNRRGYPVKPKPEYFKPDVNVIAAGQTENGYVLQTAERDGVTRVIFYVQSGRWQLEARWAGDDLSLWQPVILLSPGATGAYAIEEDFFIREYRVIAAE